MIVKRKISIFDEKSRFFSFKEKKYIAYDYPKKKKIVAIIEDISEDNNSQNKEWFLLKSHKKACLFVYHSFQKTYFVKIFLLFNIY